MRYLALAIRHGSISKAAAELQLAQTALSIQIRDLEKHLGVKLLLRHSRGVAPTKAGALLHERIGEMEGLLERTVRDVRAVDGAVPTTFTIGLNPSIMRLVGADTLLVAASVGQFVSVRLVEELSFVLREAMERKELDVAFAYDLESRANLIREPVAEDELLFVTAAGGMTSDAPISFADAIKHELHFAGTRGIVTLVTHTAERLGLTPRIASDVQSVPAIRARIAQGGASLLPYGTVADGVRRGLYAVRRVEHPVLTRTLYMIRRNGEEPVLDNPVLGNLLVTMVRNLHAQSAPYSRILDPRFMPDRAL